MRSSGAYSQIWQRSTTTLEPVPAAVGAVSTTAISFLSAPRCNWGELGVLSIPLRSDRQAFTKRNFWRVPKRPDFSKVRTTARCIASDICSGYYFDALAKNLADQSRQRRDANFILRADVVRVEVSALSNH